LAEDHNSRGGGGGGAVVIVTENHAPRGFTMKWGGKTNLVKPHHVIFVSRAKSGGDYERGPKQKGVASICLSEKKNTRSQREGRKKK